MTENNPDAFLRDISGVLHVGANIGQERGIYAQYNLDVLWIEPIPEVFYNLNKNLEDYPRQVAYQYLITDTDYGEYTFYIANNNGESSSILNLNLHKDVWPEVVYERAIILKSLTLATFVQKENIDLDKYDALIMDTQGSELLVLKGGQVLLNRFKYIKTEVPNFASYSDCCQLADVESFLMQHGFQEYSRNQFASHKDGGAYFDIVYKRVIS